MKRANQLQPLSRQHHFGLHISRHAKECADNPQEITKHWQALSSYMSDMHNHFKMEDSLIVNALRPHQSTKSDVAGVLDTLSEQLNALMVKINASQQENKNGQATGSIVTVAQVRELANLLYDHVRFEERELFPMVEKYLTEDELNAVYKAAPDNIKYVDEHR